MIPVFGRYALKLRDITLADRYALTSDPVLLSGTQALVRLLLMQSARDRAAGHRTAGFVTGYRGSPLGALDQQLLRAGTVLDEADILFRPGLNEDLATTALWGTQRAHLQGEGTHDGVFGLWYGKGPGVDRSGDAMRHANMAGTAPLGGVLMAVGDDHTGESSTTCHQSEPALVDVHTPILSPAGVQEILDYGLYGWALSRYAGVWAGLKLMKDTVEVTSVVDGRPDRMQFVTPDDPLPAGGLGIRLGDHWVLQEERLLGPKRAAAEAFARANRIDTRVWGRPGARIGFVAAGKNWLDLVHALGLLGLDAATAEAQGITTYKVGQTWPLDGQGLLAWAEGLDLIVVVEEKRKLIEGQIRDVLFDQRGGRRVYGGRKGAEGLFPSHHALDPVDIAVKLGGILIEEGRGTDDLRGRIARLAEAAEARHTPDIARRRPWYCAGCPHNTSTVVPEGSRSGAGIGCHTMALWMDRRTEGYTHMGAEGLLWVGEAPFSTRSHMFQNLGDGTYNHSGLMAIRAAVAAGTNLTYKILFNDAVAMTGGQPNDGNLTPQKIVAELVAAGVGKVVVVHDEKEHPGGGFPSGVAVRTRTELDSVQQELRETKGVSAIVYVQTCAAEKRRRRKRGTFDDPPKRLFINPDVCEGCGDCGVQSNCVALLPLDTPLGRKRQIDQSACNKDYSCLKGFCPSFVTVEGAEPRRAAVEDLTLPRLPEPALPTVDGTWNMVITGIGGTGVVTIGATLAMAAHLEHRAAAMMEMAGLAQKGGAVHIHLRLAERPKDITAVRVAAAEADALIGGDLLVSGGTGTLALLQQGRSHAVVNRHETPTGEFALDRTWSMPSARLRDALQARVGARLRWIDATALAQAALGDAIFANMLLLGAAWQAGQVPLTRAAILHAIALNGAAVPANQRAFEIGRWAIARPEEADALLNKGKDLPAEAEVIDVLAAHLTAYQSARLARRFRALVDSVADPELQQVVARSYAGLLAYKDEYEVARLLRRTDAQVAEAFVPGARLTYHLAPPLLARRGPDGRPQRRAFGPWIRPVLALLAALKVLRGTPLDPFGYGAERRAERALIRQFEADMSELPRHLTAASRANVLALASLPQGIRGFGPVKRAAMDRAAAERSHLLAAIRAADPALAAVATAAE
jgi:indolepyruvate ferredoxin oxidoreductase